MTTTTTTGLAEVLASLAQAESPDFTPWQTGPDGAEYRARIRPDDGAGDFMDQGDNGKIAESPRHSRQRPPGFNGAAVKIDTRGGPVWWQPPTDVVGDAHAFKVLRDRVQTYYHDEWHYVGVVVERRSAPCPHCGERKTTNASLWGIESDAGEYFEEVINELIHELAPEVTV